MNDYSKLACEFCDAIKVIAKDDNLLFSLECYLSNHFDVWLSKYCTTPEGITDEFIRFSQK